MWLDGAEIMYETCKASYNEGKKKTKNANKTRAPHCGFKVAAFNKSVYS